MINHMPKRYAAFISYAHRYRDWVATLQANLEQCLREAGADPGEIFLDQTDLASGRSWVGQLQEGLSKSDHLILVATPEALASPRVENEWDAFIAARPDWARGHFHVVSLVDVPLPSFLDRIQRLNFVDHDDEQYRNGLQKLLAALLHRGPRELPELSTGLEIPAAPAGVLPTDLRRRLVAWLTPQVERKILRPTVADALGIQPAILEGHSMAAGAASAALVAATGDDNRTKAALRIVRSLCGAFEEEDAELLSELKKLTEELERVGRDGEGGLLSAWLAKACRDHSNLVPFYEHADLELLDRVYVQLELRPEERLLRGREDLELGFRINQLTISDLLTLECEDHGWVTQRWVVRGDPGAGKTTLLRHLAAKLASAPERRWIPIFESLPRLVRKPEWLLNRLEREMRKAGETVQGMAAALDREGREGRLLLLLDGLDEVPREEREDAEALLRQLSARWPETPLVVTSRPIGYRRPGSEFVELELMPFDDGQRQEFLVRWFGRRSQAADEDRAAEVMAVLRADRGLWDLSGNPLYLTLMALLFEEGKRPERNRATLYDQVFELLLEGRHRPGGQPIDAQKAVREVLRRLAFDMTADNRDTEPKAEIEGRLYQENYDRLRRPLERVRAWRRSLGPFLDDLSEKVGILGPHDGPSADWRYWHRTFREALAAEQLETDLRSGGEASILERAEAVAGDESRWAEPYALLVGRVKDPDRLVSSLVEANRALGLRAVATAQRLSDDTVRAVLNLTDNWKERIKVYEEIPELLDDPERTLALVDQLRRRTSNGNDLFFLDEAAVTVGRRWPESQRLVSELRRRFFDHLPPPPADLFERVETRDGEVDLWCEIPAGTFLMGSPEDEEGRDDDEGPQHEVRIASPFRMAAGPVTVAQYRAFDPGHRSFFEDRVPEKQLAFHPIDSVTWYQAVSFCRWLATRFSGARLPSEEEWEYVCRAGTKGPYWNGNTESSIKEAGWYAKNSKNRTHPVGEKLANPWGLYDVHGNVREWTATEWDPAQYKDREGKVYPLEPASSSADLAVGDPRIGRVVRGGSYFSAALWCRSAYRSHGDPGIEARFQGFRVLLPLTPDPSPTRSHPTGRGVGGEGSGVRYQYFASPPRALYTRAPTPAYPSPRSSTYHG